MCLEASTEKAHETNHVANDVLHVILGFDMNEADTYSDGD